MNLSSISKISIFLLLAIHSTNIFGNPWNSVRKSIRNYFFPKQGSVADYVEFEGTLECPNCRLQGFPLAKIINNPKNASKKVNLSRANCTGADLSNVNLSKANLDDTILNGANLDNSDLSHATLWFAHLKNAKMRNTNMHKAILNFANLYKANLKGADLTDAHLSDTDMQSTNIYNAQLDRASLHDTNFNGAKVNRKTSFEGAYCMRTDLRNIKNLHKTDLKSSAHLRDCKMGFDPKPTLLQKMSATFAPILGLFSKK